MQARGQANCSEAAKHSPPPPLVTSSSPPHNGSSPAQAHKGSLPPQSQDGLLSPPLVALSAPSDDRSPTPPLIAMSAVAGRGLPPLPRVTSSVSPNDHTAPPTLVALSAPPDEQEHIEAFCEPPDGALTLGDGTGDEAQRRDEQDGQDAHSEPPHRVHGRAEGAGEESKRDVEYEDEETDEGELPSLDVLRPMRAGRCSRCGMSKRNHTCKCAQPTSNSLLLLAGAVGICESGDTGEVQHPPTVASGAQRAGRTERGEDAVARPRSRKLVLTTPDGSCLACANPSLKRLHICDRARPPPEPLPEGAPPRCLGCMPGRNKVHTCGRSRADKRNREECWRCEFPRSTRRHTCALGESTLYDRAVIAQTRAALVARIARGECIRCQLKIRPEPRLHYVNSVHSASCPRFSGAPYSDDCAKCRELRATGYRLSQSHSVRKHTCTRRISARRKKHSAETVATQLEVELSEPRPVEQESATAEESTELGLTVGERPVTAEHSKEEPTDCVAQGIEEIPKPEELPPLRGTQIAAVDEMLLAELQHRSVLTLSDAIFAMARSIGRAKAGPFGDVAVW